ncbi:hypothetical protein [Azospirillum melinis]
MADDVDGVIVLMRASPLRHLRQTVLRRVQYDDLDARLHAVHKLLIVGDVRFDEDDFLAAIVPCRIGSAHLHWYRNRSGHRCRFDDRLGLRLGGCMLGTVIGAVMVGGGGVGAVVGCRIRVSNSSTGRVEHEARFQRIGQRRTGGWFASRLCVRFRTALLRRTLHLRELGLHRHTRQQPERGEPQTNQGFLKKKPTIRNMRICAEMYHDMKCYSCDIATRERDKI